ncbi:MAG: L-threonylcarbamoyladenylate synthase [Rhodospirillales bacterium]
MPETTCIVLKNDTDGIATAARSIRAGRLVAFPTETVYGLGADATNDHAVAAIFAAKGRPHFNPLIVHFADADEIAHDVIVDDRAEALAATFWPGPLTLILPRRRESRISLLAGAGLDTLAVRVPAHETALAVIRAAACPIAAPSANRSGHVSPTRARHVLDDLGHRIAAVIDGGDCAVGIESTVLDLSTPTPAVLRPGKISTERIETVIGTVHVAAPSSLEAPKSPGRLERHYAPERPLRMNADRARPGEALLGFGPDTAGAALNLSPTGDLTEAAANLFAMIRALDTPENQGIAVMPIPEAGLGRAINDRLRRASHR